jgi:tetratricopeptide (TPR) repeat protein
MSFSAALKRFRLNRPAAIGMALLYVGVLASFLLAGRLGFESPVSLIQETLSSVSVTPHFFIHYAPGSFTPEEVRHISAEHEFRLHQVEDALQTEFPGPINSYIYPDDDTKHRFIGTATTNIAKPWRQEIHLGKDSWEATLRHELTHVVAGSFGMPVIRANYNTGIVEGLAMAVDPVFGNRTLHEYAAAVLRFGIIEDPAPLVSPIGFMTHSSSLSYVLMGSFCRFLIDRYGMPRFKQLYSGRSTSVVYGESYDALLDEWQSYLQRIDVPEEWRPHVDYYFRRPSIFAKECVRTIAKLNDQGWRNFEAKDYSGAMSAFTFSLDESKNTEAVSGILYSAFAAAKYDTLAPVIAANGGDSTLGARLLIEEADALWQLGNPARADSIYNRVLALDLSRREDESAELRHEVCVLGTQGAPLKRFFVAGSLADAKNILDSATFASPLLPYMRAKVEIAGAKFDSAAQHLETVAGKLPSQILNAAAEQSLAHCYFMLGNYQKSREAYWLALNYEANPASMADIYDNVERCEWYLSKTISSGSPAK